MKQTYYVPAKLLFLLNESLLLTLPVVPTDTTGKRQIQTLEMK